LKGDTVLTFQKLRNMSGDFVDKNELVGGFTEEAEVVG
jgi:hypothetical protein